MPSKKRYWRAPISTAKRKDSFHVLRTVVFYPILREDAKPNETLEWVEKFVRAFGRVAEVKYLFTEMMTPAPMPQDPKQPSSVRKFVGCAIVVYWTAVGAYAALTGVDALKRHSDDAKYLNVKALWSLLEFIGMDQVAQGNPNYLNPEVSSVRNERGVLVLLEAGLTMDHLQSQINNSGMPGTVQMLSARPDVSPDVLVNSPDANIPAVLVTFTRPLHAMVFAACYLSPHLKVKIIVRDSNNNHGSYFWWAWSPTVLYSYDITPLVHESSFEALYLNMTDHYRTTIPSWRKPKEIFPSNEYYTPGIARRPICLRAIKDYFPKIIFAIAKDITVNDHGNVRIVRRFTYFELSMKLEQAPHRLSLPARFVLGRRRWAFCFELQITKHRFPGHVDFRPTYQLQTMNHVFPKLHPDIFNTNEHNFTFLEATDHCLRPVEEGYKEHWRRIWIKVAWDHGRRYNPDNFPCLHLIDGSFNSYDLTWTFPVIIYSDSIHTTDTEHS